MKRTSLRERVVAWARSAGLRGALPLFLRALAIVAVGLVSARGVLVLLRKLVVTLAGTGLLLAWILPALAASPLPARAYEQPLVIESIEVEGNTRTSDKTVFRYLALAPGGAATPDSILARMEELRASGLFRSVTYESRAGSERGSVVLYLTVQEKPVEFRLGAGYQDLSGWYLIPAELRFDNRLGRGEEARVHAKLGYRLAGIHLFYEEPSVAGSDYHWGFSFSGAGGDRVYFVDGLEYRHNVGRGSVEAHAGRKLGSRVAIEIGVGTETIDADSSAEAGEDSEARRIERGDELPFEDLPAEVASDLGESERALLRADLTWDSRSARLVAGTPASGGWGRIRASGTFPDEGKEFPTLAADLRVFRAAGSVAFAARARGGATGEAAPWYDRFYVGGLYTVRGYPSQSLSGPGGETRFWSASIELRAPIVGRPEEPRLAAIAFVDAGDAWSVDEAVSLNDVAVGIGWGIRLRVPWIGWLGVDAARPLSESPVHEGFHGNASIGMTF